jgi:hypothetical protein
MGACTWLWKQGKDLFAEHLVKTMNCIAVLNNGRNKNMYVQSKKQRISTYTVAVGINLHNVFIVLQYSILFWERPDSIGRIQDLKLSRLW